MRKKASNNYYIHLWPPHFLKSLQDNFANFVIFSIGPKDVFDLRDLINLKTCSSSTILRVNSEFISF